MVWLEPTMEPSLPHARPCEQRQPSTLFVVTECAPNKESENFPVSHSGGMQGRRHAAATPCCSPRAAPATRRSSPTPCSAFPLSALSPTWGSRLERGRAQRESGYALTTLEICIEMCEKKCTCAKCARNVRSAWYPLEGGGVRTPPTNHLQTKRLSIQTWCRPRHLAAI